MRCTKIATYDISGITSNGTYNGEVDVDGGISGNVSGFANYTITNRGPLNLKPISGLPSCAAGSYAGQGTLSWNGQPDTNGGYWVDISPDNFAAVFYNKYVSGGLTNTDTNGFNGFSGASGSLQLLPGTTYSARVYNGLAAGSADGAGHSNIVPWTVPFCAGGSVRVVAYGYASSAAAGAISLPITWTLNGSAGFSYTAANPTSDFILPAPYGNYTLSVPASVTYGGIVYDFNRISAPCGQSANTTSCSAPLQAGVIHKDPVPPAPPPGGGGIIKRGPDAPFQAFLDIFKRLGGAFKILGLKPEASAQTPPDVLFEVYYMIHGAQTGGGPYYQCSLASCQQLPPGVTGPYTSCPGNCGGPTGSGPGSFTAQPLLLKNGDVVNLSIANSYPNADLYLNKWAYEYDNYIYENLPGAGNRRFSEGNVPPGWWIRTYASGDNNDQHPQNNCAADGAKYDNGDPVSVRGYRLEKSWVNFGGVAGSLALTPPPSPSPQIIPPDNSGGLISTVKDCRGRVYVVFKNAPPNISWTISGLTNLNSADLSQRIPKIQGYNSGPTTVNGQTDVNFLATDGLYAMSVPQGYTVKAAVDSYPSGLIPNPTNSTALSATLLGYSGVSDSGPADSVLNPDSRHFLVFEISPAPAAANNHLECLGSSCASVSGGGGNLNGCATAGQTCSGGLNHLACQSSSCAVVSGNGANDPGCANVGDSCTLPGGAATLVISPPVASAAVGTAGGNFNALYDPDGPSGPAPEQNITGSAVWTSSDNSIANPIAPGVYQGKRSGSITAFAAYNGLKANASLNVFSPTNPDFLLTLTPSSALVAPGSSANYTVQISPLSGFSGQVSLSGANAPPAAALKFAPSVISSSQTSVLTVATDRQNTPLGAYTLNVTGASVINGSSVSHNAPAYLTVTDAVHLICQNNACAAAAGAGTNDPGCANVGDSCTPPGGNRYSCQGSSCVKDNITPGKYTTPNCNNACGSPPPPGGGSHKECVSNACTNVVGAGPNRCEANADCGGSGGGGGGGGGGGAVGSVCDPVLLVCKNLAGGGNVCSSDPNCAGVGGNSHLECQNNTCLIVGGSGLDQCTTIGSGCTAPQTCTFTASPALIAKGGSSKLTWACGAGVSNCSLTSVGSVSSSGSAVVNPSQSTLYTLTCKKGGVNVISTINVKVSTIQECNPNDPTCKPK